MKKTKDINFEDGLIKLEELVTALEGRTLGLDQALASFEEGLKLCQQLSQKLREAEGRVEMLTKDHGGLPKGREFILPDQGGETRDEDEDDDL